MLTAKGLGGFVSNPSTDRKTATSALAASVGQNCLDMPVKG